MTFSENICKPQSVETIEALAPLRDLKRWVIWRYETVKDKNGKPKKSKKPTKVPYQARTPRLLNADSTDPSTWATFDAAVAAAVAHKVNGTGFCLLDSDIAAFDIDNCRDPKT